MPAIKQQQRLDFKRWFSVGQGMALGACEREQVAAVLPGLFGYHIVQIGAVTQPHYLHGSRIGNKVICRLVDEGHIHNDDRSDVNSDDHNDTRRDIGPIVAEQALPFLTAGIDVAVAPHVLEFAAQPHKLLRELERILIGDGHLLILGFNPWSLWGLWRLFLGWRGKPPWSGHFYSPARIRDWLCLLDFEIVRTSTFIFRPPLRHKRLMRRIMFLERLGSCCWPYFGSVYMILARKRTTPLTPIKLRWQRQRLAAGVAEPTTRAAAPMSETRQ